MPDESDITPGGTPGAGDAGTETPGGGQFDGPEWLGSLPAELHSSASLRKFADVENLARGYVNAERLIGTDKIPVPKTDDDYKQVFLRLGASEDPKEYDLGLDALPAEVQGDIKAQADWFAEQASKLGITKTQAKGLVSEYGALLARGHAEAAANENYEFAMAQDQLRKEFGPAYDQRIALATRAASHFFSPELKAKIDASGLGRNAEFIKFCADLGLKNAEDIGVDKNGQTADTPSSLMEEISKAQAHPAYLDPTHPDHARIVRAVEALYQRMGNVGK